MLIISRIGLWIYHSVVWSVIDIGILWSVIDIGVVWSVFEVGGVWMAVDWMVVATDNGGIVMAVGDILFE